MSNIKIYKVSIRPLRGTPGPAREVEIDAVNPPEAIRFAEARYPGFKAGWAKQIG